MDALGREVEEVFIMDIVLLLLFCCWESGSSVELDRGSKHVPELVVESTNGDVSPMS